MGSKKCALAVFMLLAAGCNGGDDQIYGKASVEGKATAEAELKAQLDAKDQLIAKAREEGKAAAEAELQAQMENLDLLIQRARAEGQATAQAELSETYGYLSAKAQEMEADLASRQLFYQSVRGTYEGALRTERGDYRVRITLVPSLPPYLASRTRQLEEITSDINNLYFHAQIVQWNPANRLSAVGCRAENIRADIVKGEISIASASCPNLYVLQIADDEMSRAADLAGSIRDGKMSELRAIRGEMHPSTNAAIYPFKAERVSGQGVR